MLLCQDEDYTRINKLSNSLHVRPSSASKMVSRLVELGFLVYDSHDCIRLTILGKSTGAYLLERHQIIADFFALIASINSLEETELVEHMLSPTTVLKIQSLLEFFRQNPSIYHQFLSFMESSDKLM